MNPLSEVFHFPCCHHWHPPTAPHSSPILYFYRIYKMLHPDGDDGCWSENRISASFHHWATHRVWQRGVPHVLSINQIFSIVVLNSATFNWKGGTTSTAGELHYNQDLSWSWLFQKRKSLFVMDLQGVSQRHTVYGYKFNRQFFVASSFRSNFYVFNCI